MTPTNRAALRFLWVGADVIIRDSTGRILIVDPTYKSDWDLPGGMAEANEPPHQAAQRELREELGLRLDIHRLLWVDWVSPARPVGRLAHVRLRRRHAARRTDHTTTPGRPRTVSVWSLCGPAGCATCKTANLSMTVADESA